MITENGALDLKCFLTSRGFSDINNHRITTGYYSVTGFEFSCEFYKPELI